MEVDSFRMSVRVRNWSSSGWRSMVFCLALALLMGIWVELGIGDLEREKEERERLEMVVFLRKLLFGDVIYRDVLNFILSTRFMIENYL